ncbi:MAG TPA: hypothetical protein VHX67_11585 [Acidimicrobiales bacterium]|jgi:hypothetical protein|nr:hypothetical protein [Acidimicrobiales bacterium]
MPRAVRTWSIRLLILPASALALAACSSSPSSSSSSTTPTSSATTTTASSPSTTPSTSQTSGTLVPQTPTGTEFYSPSKNISCEIDNNFGSSAITTTLCLTFSPQKSVTLQADGSLTECTGVNCLSNAGVNTPTLAYGQSITLGPFTCASSTAGIKCTVASGEGFLISSSATTALGNATVTTGSS